MVYKGTHQNCMGVILGITDYYEGLGIKVYGLGFLVKVRLIHANLTIIQFINIIKFICCNTYTLIAEVKNLKEMLKKNPRKFHKLCITKIWK